MLTSQEEPPQRENQCYRQSHSTVINSKFVAIHKPAMPARLRQTLRPARWTIRAPLPEAFGNTGNGKQEKERRQNSARKLEAKVINVNNAGNYVWNSGVRASGNPPGWSAMLKRNKHARVPYKQCRVILRWQSPLVPWPLLRRTGHHRRQTQQETGGGPKDPVKTARSGGSGVAGGNPLNPHRQRHPPAPLATHPLGQRR